MAKLKVFKAHQGFFETVVAAPSQKAALEAWGTRQNLFAEGMAEVTEDAATVAAATDQPGRVLRRAAGSGGAFTAEGGDLKAPDLPKAKDAKATAKSSAPDKSAKPPPDLTALNAAETALEAAEKRHNREEAALQRQSADIQQRIRDQAQLADRNLKALRKALERERAAYRRAADR